MRDIFIIIDSIKDIMPYVLPGICFIGIIRKITSIRLRNLPYAWAVIIFGFIIKSLLPIHKLAYTKEIAISCIISFFLAIICSLFINSNRFTEVTKKFLHITINESIFRDIIDMSNGVYVDVRFKNNSYALTGVLSYFDDENENSDRWFSVINYKIYNTEKINDEGYEVVEDYEDESKRFYLFRLSDVESIRIIQEL